MKLHRTLLALLLILSSCGVLQPVKDPAVRHMLDPLVAERPLKSSSPMIAIKRPSIPGYLDRQQLVTRKGDVLVLSELDLWAESLDVAISRVTATNLSRLTGSMNIRPVENFTTLDYPTLLELDLTQFEPGAANTLILQGTWQLQPVNGKPIPTHFFRIEVPIPSPPDSLAGRITAMNRALECLARQIAAKQHP